MSSKTKGRGETTQTNLKKKMKAEVGQLHCST